MCATARPIDGLCHEVSVNDRHTIVTDEPERLGGTDLGPAPHELLAAALAACISTVLAMYARVRDWDLGHLRVDVGYDPRSVPRHFEVEVRLPTSLTAEQITRLERIAASCPIRKALETGFSFEERFVPQ
jgi:putative redox protein